MNHIQKFSEFNNKPENTNEGFKEWATIFATALALNLVPPQIAKADTETKKEWTEQKSDEILTKSNDKIIIYLDKLPDSVFSKLPNSFIAAESPDISFVEQLSEQNSKVIILKHIQEMDKKYQDANVRGSVNALYTFKKTFNEGTGIYTMLAIKNDKVGGDITDEMIEMAKKEQFPEDYKNTDNSFKSKIKKEVNTLKGDLVKKLRN